MIFISQHAPCACDAFAAACAALTLSPKLDLGMDDERQEYRALPTLRRALES